VQKRARKAQKRGKSRFPDHIKELRDVTGLPS
jgi:hypothetical protein